MTGSVSGRSSLAVVSADQRTAFLGGPPDDPGMASARAAGGRASDQRIGALLADTYRITRAIATGGMGTVYEAVHVRLQQRFSIKFLEHHLARDAEAYARFRQEAEIAASLDHDAIVQVFDFNTDVDGSPYMVMEFVDGVTLDDWMHGRRATPREVLRLFDPLCSALAAAHAAGIVHRDLKPSNIMIRTQTAEAGMRMGVKLLDFGISKMKSAAEAMTRTNVVMGTPNYMSPEQASGNTSSVDATTDVFALGAILYELLSGRRAFDAPSTPALLHAIVYDAPPPLTTLCPELPPAVAAVAERCLSKAPSDRFSDTHTLMVALRAALRTSVQPKRTAEVTTIEPVVQRRSGATPWIVASVISCVATAGAFAWASSQAGSKSAAAAVEPVAAPANSAAAVPVVTDVSAGYREGLATPGALVLESGTSLYRADARGLSYWADADAETVMRPLPSPALVTSLSRAREGDLLVGQADGTVTRWDRELREVPWQQRVGAQAIHGVAAAAGYLALGIGSEVQLVHSESAKLLRKFDGNGAAIGLVFTRHPSETLLILRRGELELVDADKRKSLGVTPLSGHALRMELVAEPIDAPAEVDIDFLQGDWILRRRYRVHSARRGHPPRLEPVSQVRL